MVKEAEFEGEGWQSRRGKKEIEAEFEGEGGKVEKGTEAE